VEKMNRKFVMVVAFDKEIRIINNPLASLDMAILRLLLATRVLLPLSKFRICFIEAKNDSL
jgi:hypothetical protein